MSSCLSFLKFWIEETKPFQTFKEIQNPDFVMFVSMIPKVFRDYVIDMTFRFFIINLATSRPASVQWQQDSLSRMMLIILFWLLIQLLGHWEPWKELGYLKPGWLHSGVWNENLPNLNKHLNSLHYFSSFTMMTEDSWIVFENLKVLKAVQLFQSPDGRQ